MTNIHRFRVNLCNHSHYARDNTSFWLSSRHTAKTSRNKYLTRDFFSQTFLDLFTSSIQHCDSRTVHNTLWTDIHIRTSGHLTILAHTKSIEFFPVVRFRIIRNYHTICHHHAWSIFMRWEQSHWVTRVHNQCLLVSHLAKIFHSQTILSPVLEHRAITAISNQLVWVLSHSIVKVIINHQHNRCCLFRASRIIIDITRLHFIIWAQTIHINTSIRTQLLSKFRSQLCMVFFREIAQRITQCQLFFLCCQNLFTLRSMVNLWLISLWLWQYVRNTCRNVFSKFFKCHKILVFKFYFLFHFLQLAKIHIFLQIHNIFSQKIKHKFFHSPQKTK